MISINFIILAAICNAVMDKISFHFENSIFNGLNKYFWNPYWSWKNKYVNQNPYYGRRKFLGIKLAPTFTDAWHLFKSIMIVFMILAVVFYNPIVCILVDVIIYGIVWNVVFNLCFNHLFKYGN